MMIRSNKCLVTWRNQWRAWLLLPDTAVSRYKDDAWALARVLACCLDGRLCGSTISLYS